MVEWGLGAIVMKRKDINATDPEFVRKNPKFQMPNCSDPLFCDMEELQCSLSLSLSLYSFVFLCDKLIMFCLLDHQNDCGQSGKM